MPGRASPELPERQTLPQSPEAHGPQPPDEPVHEASWRGLLQTPPGQWRRLWERAAEHWLWPCITLVGAGGPCPKGILVEVSSLTEEEVCLSNGATLRLEQVCKCTRLAHCLCYASVQGLTLPGVVRLEDTDSPLFCLRKL